MSDYWINAIIYTIGWCWAIYFGAHDYALIAGLGAWACSALILWTSYKKNLKIYYQDLFLAFYALLISFGMESIFIRYGFIEYKTTNIIPFLPPIWIFSLYPLFALTLNHSFVIINKSPFMPILIGCLAPLTYLAGHRMDACEFPHGIKAMIAFFIPVWICFLSFLRWLNGKLSIIAASVLEKDKKPLSMLYDGECPICSREVTLLKHSPHHNLKFVNIGNKKTIQGISCEEAMQGMTAVDANGTVFKDIEAFKQIYARAGWLFLAILISAPGFHWLANKLYPWFAYFRLKHKK